MEHLDQHFLTNDMEGCREEAAEYLQSEHIPVCAQLGRFRTAIEPKLWRPNCPRSELLSLQIYSDIQ